MSILLIGSVKRTFLNRKYYGSRDVFFGCLGVSKGQGNETKGELYLSYLIIRCDDMIHIKSMLYRYEQL